MPKSFHSQVEGGRRAGPPSRQGSLVTPFPAEILGVRASHWHMSVEVSILLRDGGMNADLDRDEAKGDLSALSS